MSTDPFEESALYRSLQVSRTLALFAAARRPEATKIEDKIVRPLLQTEVETLCGQCQCKCLDWSQLRLLLSPEEAAKEQSRSLSTLISSTSFAGVVVIGLDITAPPLGVDELSPGIVSNSMICDCIIEANCAIHSNTSLFDTHVAQGASVIGCGRLSCPKSVIYGSMVVTVGAESGGGRVLAISSESDMIDVCEQLGASKRKRQRALQAPPECKWNIIGAKSIVRSSPAMENIFLSPNTRIQGASSVKNAVLLPGAEISNGCTVDNVLLQWNASIKDNSAVTDTLLMEHAHVGPNSVVASSVLGPDVHVSAGEVHASVIGPNTNAHHQSLLIGVLWILGRGNVGYGANVGSNHTGRLPDQETCAGEGTFWGLTTCIKFPVDLSFSPYSIVAAGSTVPPQRVAMPFSLLVEVKGEAQIIPGWVLQNSPYTLSRSEAKFANRRKATRHQHYTGWNIIRPDVIDMCIAARAELRSVQPQQTYKTDRAVRGIGKNVLSEKGRRTGIEAYTNCIQRYALHGFLDWIQRFGLGSAFQNEFSRLPPPRVPEMHVFQQPCWPALPWETTVSSSSLWNHQKAAISAEFGRQSSNELLDWACALLKRLVELENDYAKRVYECKERDDARGAATIPGYQDSHTAAEEDDVVKSAKNKAAFVEQAVSEVLKEIKAMQTSRQTRSRL